jgi:hypothetical protein
MKKLTFLLTLSVLFFIGCSTEEVSTVDSSIENDSFAKGIANAPDQSGMYVIRTELSAAAILIDTKTELTAVFGVDIEAFCSGDAFWEVEPIQYVNIPNTDEQLIALLQGDVYTFVFDGVFDGSISLCDFLLNTSVLAEGESHFIYNDNDYFGTANISNSWSIKANGQLLNQDNELKNLNAKFHGVWNYQTDHFSSSTSVKLH